MLLSAIGLALALAAALFLSSGRLNWGMAWVYIGLRVAAGAAGMLVMASRNPALLDERFHPGKDAKAWDRRLGSLSTVLSLVTLIVAGLDIRFGWSPEPALAVSLVVLIVWVLADGFSRWAAVSNRFYSRVVRIQKDRGHTVVTEGPYQRTLASADAIRWGLSATGESRGKAACPWGAWGCSSELSAGRRVYASQVSAVPFRRDTSEQAADRKGHLAYR